MPDPVGPVDVLLVTTSGCHYCDDAAKLLDRVGEEFPLLVRTAPLESEDGLALMARHRIPYPPILMVEGEFFGFGRISERKLRNHLAGLARPRVEA